MLNPQNVRITRVKALVESMNVAFVWADSPQGHAFWRFVTDQLTGIASEAEKSNAAARANFPSGWPQEYGVTSPPQEGETNGS
jgi:hypothetical protein